jgi:hypothetical protein
MWKVRFLRRLGSEKESKKTENSYDNCREGYPDIFRKLRCGEASRKIMQGKHRFRTGKASV